MSGISLDIPNVTVLVRPEGETKVYIRQPEEIKALVTGSFSNFAENSLYAQTASYALAALTAEDAFPFTGSAEVAGSLTTTQYIQTNEFRLTAGALNLIMTGSITSGIFGVSEYVLPYISTTSYSGTTIEYLANRGDATRMGIILATWSGSSIVFTDVSTADIGDTSDISFGFLHFRMNLDYV